MKSTHLSALIMASATCSKLTATVGGDLSCAVVPPHRRCVGARAPACAFLPPWREPFRPLAVWWPWGLRRLCSAPAAHGRGPASDVPRGGGPHMRAGPGLHHGALASPCR